MDRELLLDSDGVNESFWDGQSVEIEARDVLDLGLWRALVERISKIRVVSTRASGTGRASRLRQHNF